MDINELLSDKKSMGFRRQQAWRLTKAHMKILINDMMGRLGRGDVFELTALERVGTVGELGFPNKQVAMLKRAWRWAFDITTIGWSVTLLLIALFLWGIFGASVSWGDASVEWWGLIFDVAFILIGFGLIQHHRQKRDNIARQHELIEDFKRWDSEEGRLRLFGAMRRLQRLNALKVNLAGARLQGVSFKQEGIKEMMGSKFSGGNWDDERHTSSQFTNVDFSSLDFTGSQFESTPSFGGLPMDTPARYTNCDFSGAWLTSCMFDGAVLEWTEPAPFEMDEVIDTDDQGAPIFARIVMGSFNEAHLGGASFRNCTFKNADFRNSYSIELATFHGAKGLETCLFDDDEVRDKVLANSREATE